MHFTDYHGDTLRCQELSLSGDVVACIEATDGSDGEQAAVFVTRDNATELIAWLESLL